MRYSQILLLSTNRSDAVQAISEFLTDLPVELHDGSISSVAIRVPWSNPLTSTVSFSLHSLHLIFHLSPSAVTPRSRLNPNLTGSVASIADSFLHDELSPREEAVLRESFCADRSSSFSANTGDGGDIPGSIDPFLSGEDEPHLNADPAGVSMFASLIERFLSRFEFEAIDTKLTLVHPERSSFTISISEIRYGRLTEENSAPDSQGPLSGPFGTISMSDLIITARDLRGRTRLQSPPTPSTISSLTTRRASPPPHQPPTSSSSSSSSSSMNEESQFMMSQSLASLPPRPLSPASQVASSFYQSAVSNAPFAAEASQSNIPVSSDPEKVEAIIRDGKSPGLSSQPNLETQRHEIADSLILSLGAEPVIIRLTTPIDLSQTPTESHSSPPRSNSPRMQEDGKLRISLTTGVLSCALHAWHVRSLLDILDVFGSHLPSHGKAISVPNTPDSPASPSDSSSPVLAPGIEGTGNVLLTPNEDDCAREGSTSSSNGALASFFAHPLVPPQLNRGYVRTHLENLSMSYSIDTSTSVRQSKRPVQPARTKNRSRQNTMPVTTTVTRSTVTLSISGISVLAIHATADPASESTTLYASPILITDPHLPSQYPADHVYPDSVTFTVEETRSHPYPQLPTFDVIDWTDEKHKRNGVKLSTWRSRTKVKHGGRAARSSWDERVRDRVGAESPARSPPEQGKQMIPPTTKLPAILFCAETAVSLVTGGKPDLKSSQLVELKTVPLHVFVDLGMALGSDGFLSFVDQIIESGEKTILAEDLGSSCESSVESSEDESQSQAALPGIMDPSQRQKERRRLERLVLKDLDLGLDYRKSDPTKRPSNLKRRVAITSSCPLPY
jgi:autophagy-related protein 2